MLRRALVRAVAGLLMLNGLGGLVVVWVGWSQIGGLTNELREASARLSPEQVGVSELAGDRITARLTAAPANGAPIGGLKVTTATGWFAARPSGTEEVYKLYAESFTGPDHLRRIQEEAQALIRTVFEKGGAAAAEA